ncbi:hypothetical protein DQ04_03061060 [Trypanosoma grayi]|uniref:hypothetical protein n=1 Tax=Trypanosoma grayi TaxID=71804 RepID=UPI0004F46402|nr:hypothetical protein DQ04_03061060 [Trypanosoma grayi]KEG11011.1 hypothetical protein DQ04_03061060 [Trypanosoma grayi]
MLHVSPASVQAINAAALEEVRGATQLVLRSLQGSHCDGDGIACEEVTQNEFGPTAAAALDGVAAVYAEAVRQQCEGAVFREALGALPMQCQRANILADAFEDAVEALRAAGMLGQGPQLFLPQLGGVSWCLSHELGDRARNPITPSVPVFEFQFTGRGCSAVAPLNNGDEVLASVSCTPGQAEELLETLHDMLAEAERLAH